MTHRRLLFTREPQQRTNITTLAMAIWLDRCLKLTYQQRVPLSWWKSYLEQSNLVRICRQLIFSISRGALHGYFPFERVCSSRKGSCSDCLSEFFGSFLSDINLSQHFRLSYHSIMAGLWSPRCNLFLSEISILCLSLDILFHSHFPERYDPITMSLPPSSQWNIVLKICSWKISRWSIGLSRRFGLFVQCAWM